MFKKECTGPGLKALVIPFMNRESVIEFQIADTLYRHNLIWQEGVTYEAAYAKSFKLGDNWLSDNDDVIRSCSSSCKNTSVIRWNHWIDSDKFPGILEIIKGYATHDKHFAALLENEVANYFHKVNRRLTPDRKMHALGFLLEEIAVTEQAARNYLTNEIYPGPRLLPEEYLVKIYPNDLIMSQLYFINIF